MRFVVFGAGAVGGVVGGRLHEHGHDVVLIARGPHLDAIRASGLRVESPDGAVTLEVPAVGGPEEVSWRDDDVVLLAMKTQDTAPALERLAAAAAHALPVVCMQNGVENERLAARWFGDVYGVCVLCPTAHVSPGVVQAFSAPVAGVLDVGRYPSGADGTAHAIAGALDASGFSSRVMPEIMRWKYGKLLMNLGNAVDALCARDDAAGELLRRVYAEGEACLAAAGITAATTDEDAARRLGLVQMRPIDGRRRGGGSTWQSLFRGTGSAETDYLNGEIVLLGRLHGVPTPANALLQRTMRTAVAGRAAPGSYRAADLLSQLAG